VTNTGPESTSRNAPGDFYVGRHECMACGAPELEAPELMGYDAEEGSCYFRRQPETPGELEHAMRAVWASCCGAVRYSGNDPAVFHRLRSMRALGPDA
jgi:hypothetical protein